MNMIELNTEYKPSWHNNGLFHVLLIWKQ